MKAKIVYNKKTPTGVNAGCVSVRKNYVEWHWKGGSNLESLSVTIQIKATEQYFPVVLFIMLYKVVLTFESVDGIQ